MAVRRVMVSTAIQRRPRLVAGASAGRPPAAAHRAAVGYTKEVWASASRVSTSRNARGAPQAVQPAVGSAPLENGGQPAARAQRPGGGLEGGRHQCADDALPARRVRTGAGAETATREGRGGRALGRVTATVVGAGLCPRVPSRDAPRRTAGGRSVCDVWPRRGQQSPTARGIWMRQDRVAALTSSTGVGAQLLFWLIWTQQCFEEPQERANWGGF